MRTILTIILFAFSSLFAFAEDGHELWLRMTPNAQAAAVNVVTPKGSRAAKSPTVAIALDELRRYWHGNEVTLVIDTAGSDPAPRSVHGGSAAAPRSVHGGSAAVEAGGFTITIRPEGITLSSATPVGLLYGTYALLRMQETGTLATAGNTIDGSNVRFISESPKCPIRILNHWDNPNGTIERGFAGRSIFWTPDGQADLNIIKEYARANASIGINATVLNNVNAKPLMLTAAKLRETKRIADVLRPYGLRVYLAVNFASPKALGEVSTADPLDPAVRKWWAVKVKEIYKLIPDFGGFLVKANSEGEPGPMDYDRTHVDGANMLADALAPYGGRVMWRAFVYSPKGSDRASQAYDEFVPFDGQFRPNVIIQIKNGPIDFQPREPVSPLFFGMKCTATMPELQITQEYLGESIHSVFLATMWREFLDNLSKYRSLDEIEYPAFSAVANIGNDRNWCGSVMAQANWYAFGRLAWDSSLSAEQIAREWLALTWGSPSSTATEQPASTASPRPVSGDFVAGMSRVMLRSHEACVNYMMPLGLHHIFAGGHHYGPEPWCAPQGWREDWLPRYYHKADTIGLGFNRTTNGSANTRQYPDPLYRLYNDIRTCPEQLLLWFHHVPWAHKMHNGETLWESLCHHYDLGVREAAAFAEVWRSMKPYVDEERWHDQMLRYDRQAKDAWWWRDACLLYFQQFSRMPLPIDCPAPRHKLEDLIKYHLDIDNYTAAPIDKLP